MQKWVYNFGRNFTEGKISMKNLLGSKGANLAEMSSLGINVPPGFTIVTNLCNYYYNNNRQIPTELYNQVMEGLKLIEKESDLEFGGDKPLLISVRSGASISMPGMMDTILNLGLNEKTIESLIRQTNNPYFAYDSYRRFVQMYGEIVLGVSQHNFEELLFEKKFEYNVKNDNELPIEALKELVNEYKEKILFETGKDFPDNVQDQLWSAIKAVLNSWMNSRAITYRKLNNISDKLGTAVTIQSMVFGNISNNCATGVIFTRNPNDGSNYLYGEYLINAQGEDVVAGIRTPQSINRHLPLNSACNYNSMEEIMPESYSDLQNICKILENHHKDMQDIEFTTQNGKLWILQTRSGKRTAQASIKIAVDLVEEGLITKEEAILRMDPYSIEQLLHPTIDTSSKYKVIAYGLPASPGAASGQVVFSANEVENYKLKNKKVILVRTETSPEDIKGMFLAEGILTCRGGMTSHAAVVTRGMGKTCITGAGNIVINYQEKLFSAGNFIIKEGDLITINGSTGEIIIGEVPTIQPSLSKEFNKILNWADEIRRMNIRCNAETILDAKVALEFGAQGIGLCRTEHMFFDNERILYVRSMILADNLETRKYFLNKLLPLQKQDFLGLFKIMGNLPVTVRLLDPPLHEFLPHDQKEINEVANSLDITPEIAKNRSIKLQEVNPMLGHRGCRLGISFPEIYEMQIIAISEAMAELKKNFIYSNIEIMLPLISTHRELEILTQLINQTFKMTEAKYNIKLDFKLGTMIELPRAAITADKIAANADFFSFGTNDLTQTCFGISRDDSGSFLKSYKNSNILNADPFIHIDEEGVGELMIIAIKKAKDTKSMIKLGICGEHGGDPQSIMFFDKIGLDYVSCSPYRVAIARLAAAKASCLNKN